MKIEQERGISVTTAVMTFEFEDTVFNLLDTPGHEDFSEDTYRTLTAADSAVMVIDAAKGIETQTRKLFEVCRLRDIPIITFINKMDREARDPFELVDEVADQLAARMRADEVAGRLGPQFPWRARSRRPTHSCPSKGRSGRAEVAVPTMRAPKLNEEVELVRHATAAVRPRDLSRRPHDAGVLRLRAQGLRRAQSAAGDRAACAAASPAGRA